MSGTRWLALEANPDVLNKYIERLGVLKAKFIDVYSLDEEFTNQIADNILAVIMLFPLKEDSCHQDTFDQEMKKIYFCDQTIHNACGTLAVIHAILNNLDLLQLDPNSPLEVFYKETMYMTPKERGRFLENFEEIKESHSDVALEGQTSVPLLEEQLDLHFVTLVLKNDAIYELDGRKEFPIKLSTPISKEDFFKNAIRICKKRMEMNPNDIRFNVIALAHDDNYHLS